MIVLDTNVVSEGFRPRPNPAVQAWMNAHIAEELFICTPVLAEIRYGIALIDPGIRQTQLQANADALEYERLDGRILVFNVKAASAYGRLAANQKRRGLTVGRIDTFIAAIALANNADVATRNVNHFAGLGLTIINPFDFTA